MAMKKRTIVCMTGTRADYPRVKSVLKEIRARSDRFDLKLIVTGSHLLKELGYSAQEILDDGFSLDYEVPMYDGDDSPVGMTRATARCMRGVAEALAKFKPDLFLITVDRVETLAAASAGALMNIPIAHIQGGEVTGTIDESIRHAVTKLSHIHFAATPDAAERIVKMGEDPRYVYQVGCPYLDLIRTTVFRSKEDLARIYGFDPRRDLILFTQHPVTTEFGQGPAQVRMTMEALLEFPECEVVALAPNADAGGKEILEVVRSHKQFKLFPNIPSQDYLALMNCASVMVGNSSAGIREAPSFKLPVVNIGTRQNGRLRAVNVIDVPNEKAAICGAIRMALSDSEFRKKVSQGVNPYGDGYSAKRIVDILESLELPPQLVQKLISY